MRNDGCGPLSTSCDRAGQRRNYGRGQAGIEQLTGDVSIDSPADPGYARRMGTPFKPAENHSAFFHRKDGSDAASQKQFWIVAGSWRKPWAA